MSRFGDRCLATACGLVLDRCLGEPPDAIHPVAWFGSLMSRAEQRIWADRKVAGVAYAAVGVAAGAAAGRLARSTTAVVALTVAGRQLRSVAARIGEDAVNDLATARTELPALVGRDPSQLDASGVAAAVIESVAENSVDAVVAPAFWAVAAGASGAAAYRAVNTMDAMVGNRSNRYRRFGWAAARLDDAANYVPARLFAGLVVAQAGGETRRIIETIGRDASAHPSPNAGVAETAVAAVIGRELGGPLRYGTRFEDRPTLGSGPRPTPADVRSAIAIANRTEIALIGALLLAWLLDRYRRPAR